MYALAVLMQNKFDPIYIVASVDVANIPDENIVFVKEKSDKLIFLEQLRDKLQIPENKIAIVEDTVKTLDKIAKAGDYITVHVSSFLM